MRVGTFGAEDTSGLIADIEAGAGRTAMEEKIHKAV